MTKEQIKDALVAEFGPEVLAVPEAGGFDLAAWLVPGAVIAVAGGAIFIGLRRWRREGGGRDGRSRSRPSPAWTRRSRSAWTRTWRATSCDARGWSRTTSRSERERPWRYG